MRKSDEVRGRGHWLASVMFGGSERESVKPEHDTLFEKQSTRNTTALGGSETSKGVENGNKANN